MSSLPVGTEIIDQEADLLAEFSLNLKVPVLNTVTKGLQDVAPVAGLSPTFLRANYFLPLAITDEHALVAAAVPVRMAALDALKQFFNVPLQLQLAPRQWIISGLDQVYRAEAMDAASFDDVSPNGSENQDDDLETLKALAEDAPVVRLVQSLLLRAVENRASDLHLEVSQQKFRVRYRIDGVLFDAESPPRRMYMPSISHLKLRAKMNIAERRLPQDGRMKMDVAARQVDMRVSTVPTVYGESMVIRLLDQGPGLMGLESLGLDEDHLAALEAAILQPHGMILVTGPTGSGKTSTLYAALGADWTAAQPILAQIQERLGLKLLGGLE